MLLSDLIITSWQNLWDHRLRAALSILGVIIGIGSFSIMYSVGEGAKRETLRVLRELGSDVLEINLESDQSATDSMNNQAISPDVKTLLKECPSVSAASAIITSQIEFPNPSDSSSDFYTVAGVTSNFLKMFKLETVGGRLFTDFDIKYLNPVCILGSEIAASVFPNQRALNKKIEIQGYFFSVIGVLRPPIKMLMVLDDIETQVLVPISMAKRTFNSYDNTKMYVLSENTSDALLELNRFFGVRYEDDSFFTITSQKRLLEARKKSAKTFQYVLWAIGSISLLVGGIGIMNIMLVSVTERLREIGIRRALGATRKAILLQFLSETFLLCIAGALGGSLLGFFGARLVGRWTRFTPFFSFDLLLLSLIIAAVIGIVFGTYPAFRASKLDPAQVLRYD